MTESIDSSQGNWDLLAGFMAWVHEQYLKNLRAAVPRGQEGAVLADYSVGDWCFGYGSEPIPGSEGGRKGRHTKPRMRYVIDLEHARWVRLIFQWFVEVRRSLDWITRELSRRKAPKDHRSTTPGWHHDYVRRVLANRKYIGIWPWGRHTNKRNPLTGQVSQEKRPERETVKWERERPDLRIISDELFFKAQAVLLENEERHAGRRRERGQLAGSAVDAGQPRHLLQGLIRCGACGSSFQVSGAGGMYLGCVGYKRGLCDCRTRLRRGLAEEVLLHAVGQWVLSDPAWRQAVWEETRAAHEGRCQSRPDETREVDRAVAAVEQKIARLLDAIESGADDPEVGRRLVERRRERAELLRRREQLKRAGFTPQPPPTPEWVEEKMKALHEVLAGDGPAAALALRTLVGGSVTVTAVARMGRKRKFLRGTFTLSTASLMQTMTEGEAATQGPTARTEEVVLDFVEGPS